MRRLGISKIDNFLRKNLEGNALSEKNYLKKKQALNNPDDSEDYYISSDSDEDFELPVQSVTSRETKAYLESEAAATASATGEDFNST